MIHYLYILYSEKYDKFYIGETNEYKRRLKEHNNSYRSNYSSKYRPWTLVALFEIENRSIARGVESFIKNQKSKDFIKKIVSSDILSGKLSQLVRVPILRD